MQIFELKPIPSRLRVMRYISVDDPEYLQEPQVPVDLKQIKRLAKDIKFVKRVEWDFDSAPTHNKLNRLDPDFLQIEKSINTPSSQREEDLNGSKMNRFEEEEELCPISGQYAGIPPIYTAPKKKKSALRKVINGIVSISMQLLSSASCFSLHVQVFLTKYTLQLNSLI